MPAIVEVMTTRPQRHLSSSPFSPAVEPVIEKFVLDDLVSHDAHGMGRVIGVEPSAVLVDFGATKVRVTSPYRGMYPL